MRHFEVMSVVFAKMGCSALWWVVDVESFGNGAVVENVECKCVRFFEGCEKVIVHDVVETRVAFVNAVNK